MHKPGRPDDEMSIDPISAIPSAAEFLFSIVTAIRFVEESDHGHIRRVAQWQFCALHVAAL